MNEMLPIIDPPSPVAAHIQTKSSRGTRQEDCPDRLHWDRALMILSMIAIFTHYCKAVRIARRLAM